MHGRRNTRFVLKERPPGRGDRELFQGDSLEEIAAFAAEKGGVQRDVQDASDDLDLDVGLLWGGDDG